MDLEEVEMMLNQIAYSTIENIIYYYNLVKEQRDTLVELLYNTKLVYINGNNKNAIINIQIENIKDCNEKELNNYINIVIREIFYLIINPKKTENDGISDEFYDCLKKGLVELYSLIYCKKEKTPYKIQDEKSINLARKIIDGLGQNLTSQDIDNIIFRASIKDLLNLSFDGNKLYLQFEEDNNSHIKKYDIQ